MWCTYYNCKEFTLVLGEMQPEVFAKQGNQELYRVEVISKATYSFITPSIDRLRHC